MVGVTLTFILYWDLLLTHFKDDSIPRELLLRNVKIRSTESSTNLSFIPAGQTGQWQPLDRRVFGALKREAEQKLDDICVDEDLAELNMMDALAILVDVWYSLDMKTIKSAWDHLFIADDLDQNLIAAPENEAEDMGGESDDSLEEEEEEEEEEGETEDDDFVEEVREHPVPDDEEEDWFFVSPEVRALCHIR